MVAAKTSPKKTAKPKQEVLPANPEVRQLADMVKSAGDYGSYVNTLRVSLREQYRRITGNEPQIQPSAA